MTDEEFERRYKERKAQESASYLAIIRLHSDQMEEERNRRRNRKKKRYISPADKWATWERDDFRCKRCGVRRFLTVDHIVPESKDGANDLRNYQTLCKSCNSRKGTRMVWYVDGVEYSITDDMIEVLDG